MRLTRLSENIFDDQSLRDRERVFKNRREGGKALAALLKELDLVRPFALGIPTGGVPIAAEISKALLCPLDLLLARKLQLPHNTEAGFGACTTDGPLFLNDDLIKRMNLSDKQIEMAETKTREELKKREHIFRHDRPMPDVSGYDVIVADDGLASGYTMKAAIAWCKRQRPRSVTAAAPTGHTGTVARLSRGVDFLVCPNIRGGFSYAVANAYEVWRDLDYNEVIAIMNDLNKEK